MTVRVPFHLRRRQGGEPAASALFVPGRDAAVLLSLCTRLGLDPSGRVHDLSDGFLLRLDGPSSEPMPGTTRLRELSPGLFVPVDATLVPALLDDEAAGLVRDGGVVFLPGGRVLRFDRRSPVGLESLLLAPARPRREWGPLPVPPRLAERITEISRERPEPPPEALYREWEQDLHRPGPSRRESSDPEGAGPGQRAIGGDEATPGETGAAGGLMPTLHGLGDALRGLIGRAGSGARSLGEKIQWGMVDHSALVQKLLREFRQGDPGRALRHAFPMGPIDPRDRHVGFGNQLPWSRAIYNLIDLLGGSSRGQSVATWQARADLIDELRREYRKAAGAAVGRGDFRRAAYVYGRLLADHRTAAQILMRGGLHHDAAILFLKKVNDLSAAAQAFEAAGEVDRAVVLYRQLGHHEAAGDLLHRVGDEAGARAEYLRAVDRAMEASPLDWYEVGRLLSGKVGVLDPAIEAFRNGWGRRPATNAMACAQELIAIHAGRGEIQPLRELLEDSDAFFRSVGSPRDARAFYDRMAAATATVPALADLAEEVRDRALMTLADHLHRQVLSGSPPAPAVSALFGESTLWSPAFARDAQFAAGLAMRSRERPTTDGRGAQLQGVQVGRGTVTAACQASPSAELFLGFADGRILALRRSQVAPVGEVAGPVAAMAAGPDGQVLVALRHTEHGAVLTTFLRRHDGTYRARPESHFVRPGRTWLTPILDAEPGTFVGLGDDRDLVILEATAGVPLHHLPLLQGPAAPDPDPPAAAFILPGPSARYLLNDGRHWFFLDADGHRIDGCESAWRPIGGSRSPRCSVPLSYTFLDGLIKVVGLDGHGAVYSSQLWLEDGGLEVLSSLVAKTDGGYLAATQSGHSRVAAVSASRVDWLSYRTDRFQVVRTLPDPGLAHAVACFPSMVPEEVMVVLGDGFVARIEPPRRMLASESRS